MFSQPITSLPSADFILAYLGRGRGGDRDQQEQDAKRRLGSGVQQMAPCRNRRASSSAHPEQQQQQQQQHRGPAARATPRACVCRAPASPHPAHRGVTLMTLELSKLTVLATTPPHPSSNAFFITA